MSPAVAPDHNPVREPVAAESGRARASALVLAAAALDLAAKAAEAPDLVREAMAPDSL